MHQHHSFAALISDASNHDHEIAYSDLLNSTPGSEETRMLAYVGSELDQDNFFSLTIDSQELARPITAEKIQHRETTHADFLNRWCHLRLNI